MGLRNTRQAWGSLAIAFHWAMALIILGMIPLGIVASNWRLSPTKVQLFFWHKSFGILLLVLLVLRLLWRLSNTTPALPDAMPRGERILAGLSHAMLYILMAAIPLSGWVINSAANFPFKVFDLVRLPNIVEPDKALQELAGDVHLILVITLAVLLAVHVAAALRHHRVTRDEVLSRMLPGLRPRARVERGV
jgi:cytochrome b561